MRRIMTIFSLLFLSIILSGCVTIPMSDGGTLEISADGLSIIPAEEDAAEAVADTGVEAETEGEVTGVEIEVGEEIEGEEEEENVGTEESQSTNEEVNNDGTDDAEVAVEDIESEVNQEFNGEDGLGGCAVEFYLIKNRLPQGFPIPECAYIRSFELLEDQADNKRTIIAHYENSGELSEEQEINKSFLTSVGFGIVEDSIVGVDSRLTGQGNGMELTITNRLNGEDSLGTAIMYSETPIKQYAVTNSFINLTENGYGKCTDEYYTLLSVMPEDFPLSECASVNFLQIENGDSVISSAAGYDVDLYWTEAFDLYEEYAESNGYTITESEGLATQGELGFENEKYNVVLSVEKMTMEKSSVHVNISMKID